MSAPPDKPAAPATDLVTVEVDGRRLQARKGQMLIEVTDAAGITVPRFCYHKHLSVAANCRMCLVEVEKAPKPLPACATPVMDGMVVRTHSPRAREAQKGTMEFLLINHPLDCPVCDQGGECMLQDLSVGYGKDVSRYHEAKRVVADKDIGPLIATEMTRCIHCMRCVRFGEEIAGQMELGAPGRGEHTEVSTYLEGGVSSELSGNMIDLCPVGALTSRPYRYTARPWELRSLPSVSPHDCVGANLTVQTRRGQVMRVLPQENDAINWCWIADRDRFSYEAVNRDDRLTAPMIRRGGKWEETDWNTALEAVATGLKRVVSRHGAAQTGALAAPISTLEEFYLLQKLMRALGSGNVDHRLRQTDFGDDSSAPVYPALGMSLAGLETCKAVLLIGSNLRKDQPLINLRVRKGALKGARVMALNAVDYDFNFPLANKLIVEPIAMAAALARIVVAAAALKRAEAPAAVKALAATPGAAEKAMAETLAGGDGIILLGSYALDHHQAALLRSLAALLAELTGATVGQLPPGNSVGGWLAGCVPHRGPAGQVATISGQNAYQVFREPLKAYLLLGAEPELDCLDGAQALRALAAAELVVMFSAFKPAADSRASGYAHVLLPILPFTENEGTFVNTEGRRQGFSAAVPAAGEARPGWKVLRVLANRLGLAGFEQNSIDDVRAEIPAVGDAGAVRTGSFDGAVLPPAMTGQLLRIAEVPIYAGDALTRRAASLQATPDNPPPAARVSPVDAARLGLRDGETVLARMAGGEASLPLVIDERVAPGCVVIAAGYVQTAELSGHGAVTLARA